MAAIAAYMKLAYKTWNREHYVSDEIIKADLRALSKGQLVIPEDQSLDNLVSKNAHRRRGGSSNSGGKRGSNYSNRGGRRKSGGRGRNYKK